MVVPGGSIQAALNTLAPGQTACVRAGIYVGGLVYARALTSYITLRCDPGAVLTNPSSSVNSGHILRINEPGAFLRVEGCKFSGAGVTSGGVIDSYGSHIQIVRNEITGSNDNGIYTDEAADHNEILRNWIHHNGSPDSNQDHGIYLQGDDHLVANNLIHDQPQGFGIQHYDYGRRARIVNNTITHNGHGRPCCGGIVIGGAGSGPGGSGVSGTIVANNIVAFNRNLGISRDSTSPTSCSIHHNLSFGNTGSQYGAGFPSGCFGVNLTADALFVDVAARNFRVQAGSPAIDAGDSLLAVSPAFDGVTRPTGPAPDIGAFER